MNIQTFIKSTKKLAKKHSPEILTGIGIAGMITAAVMAVKATPKAMELIREEEWYENDKGQDVYASLTTAGKVKACWKCYIPSAVTSVVSIACIIGASSVNARRNAALATAYTISETALKDYKAKALEVVGEKKEQAIREAVIQDKMDKHPKSSSEVIVAKNGGETLCYDAFSGRYFKSDIESLKKSVNELNRWMIGENSLTLNDFYVEIGLEPTSIGEQIGWRIDKNFIELQFSAKLADDGTPCMAFDFVHAPTYDF